MRARTRLRGKGAAAVVGALRLACACAAVAGALRLAHAEPASEGSFDPARPTEWSVPAADLYGVAARGDRAWAVGYWGTVLRTEDGGSSWSPADTPTARTLFDVAFADNRHGWAVGEWGTVLRSVDGGHSWQLQPVSVPDGAGGVEPITENLFGVAALSPTEAWAVGDLGRVIRVRDGEHWQAASPPESAFADDETPERIYNAVRFSDPRNGWIVGEFGTVLRTHDGGETWTGEKRFEGAPPELYLFDVAVADPARAAVVGLAGTVLVTRDGGATWQPRSTDTTASLYGIALADSTALVVGDRGVMFVGAPAHGAWSKPERPRMFNWLADVTGAGGSRYYAVGEKGLVLRSEDGGARWTQLHGKEPPPFGGVSVPEPGRKRAGQNVPGGPKLLAPSER